MNGFFDRFEDQLVAAAQKREKRRLPRGAAIAAVAALLVPAAALGGRAVLGDDAPPPPPPPADLETPDGFDRVGPVSRPAFIASGSAPNGHPWRISAYSCGDRRYDHVILGLSTSERDGSRPCHFTRRDAPPVELTPRETYNSAIDATIVYGGTSERVKAVDIRSGGRTTRVATRRPPPGSDLPDDFRFFVHQLPGQASVSGYEAVYEPR